MSFRALALGFLLGMFICLATYFNDFVMNGASLVNHLLPISVLGFVLTMALLVNPVIGRLRPGWAFSAGEIGVVAALALAACYWPDSGFFRTAITNVTVPAQQYLVHTHWQQQKVFSYVPGGASEIAPGQLLDPIAVARRLLLGQPVLSSGDSPTGPGAVSVGSPHPQPHPQPHPHPQPELAHLWSLLSGDDHLFLQRAAALPAPDPQTTARLLEMLNRLLAHPGLAGSDSLGPVIAELPPDQRGALAARTADTPAWDVVAANRPLLAALLPGLIASPPSGRGLLLQGGRQGKTQDRLFRPAAVASAGGGLAVVDWSAWWPTIRLWGGLALLLASAALALALIVHPQWSRNELLPYPIPRFVTELTDRPDGALLPRVAVSRLFWIAFTVVLLIHVNNGLHQWYSWPFHFPDRLDFNPLRGLFPNASRSPSSEAVFWPIIFLSVIAFAYFLETSVSLSLGIAPVLYILLTTFLLGLGIKLNYDYIGGEKPNMLRFGAYLGMAVLILYVGRRHYLDTLAAALGHNPGRRVDRSLLWAARAFVLATLSAVLWLTTAGVGWIAALLAVGCVLLTFLVLARITAETGLFFIQPQWLPVGVLTALLGFEALGPTAYIVLALVSTMLVGDTRAAVLPLLVNGLRMTDPATDQRPARLAPAILLTLLLGFGVAGAATLWVTHTHGIARTDNFTREILPRLPFDRLASHASSSLAVGELARSVAAPSDLQRLGLIDPSPDALTWTALGMGLVLAALVLRLRFVWWPIHPVLFVVWGTWAMDRFAFSILVGCCIKWCVVRFGGARGYRAGIPLMVGVIAGELAVSALWLLAGALHYLLTGYGPPARFTVF